MLHQINIYPVIGDWYNIFLPVPPINWSSWFGFLNSEKKRIFYYLQIYLDSRLNFEKPYSKNGLGE